LGDISNINNENIDPDEPEAEVRNLILTNVDAGRIINVRPINAEYLSEVVVNCGFVNNVKLGNGVIPFKENISREDFEYSVFEHNENVSQDDKLAGFNLVRYKLKYPDNTNTTLVDIDDQEHELVWKCLRLKLTELDIANNYIGFHDSIIIPMSTSFYKQEQSVTQSVWEALKYIGKEGGKTALRIAGNYLLPYAGDLIAGLIPGGGNVNRYDNRIEWQNPNLLPPPNNRNSNINERTLKLYKNGEIPIIVNDQVDYVSRDSSSTDVERYGIYNDEEEPIWAGSTNVVVDILDCLDVTLTENNSVFEFDIDQYSLDPVVMAASSDAPRPMGIKSVRINVDVPPDPIVPYVENVTYSSTGSFTLVPTSPHEYMTSANIVVDVPSANITQISNYPISQNGTQIVPIPSGYDAVDSISLNVQVPQKINIDRIGYEGGTYLFSSFSINTTDNYVTVPSRKMFFNFVLYNTSIRYKMIVNNTQGNTNIRPFVNTNTHLGYYIVADYSSTVVESIYLKTSNDENVIMITDDDAVDSSAVTGYVFRQFIDFIDIPI